VVQNGAGRYARQRPVMHSSPGSQFAPQPPQFNGSVCVSTHAEPHAVSPVPQPVAVETHAPAEQISPVPHACPHVPQFAGSDCVSTHDAGVPHEVNPVSQVHAPAAQNCRSPHVVPQSPQLRGSLVTSTHAVPPPVGHVLPPVGQTHELPTQKSVPQSWPQVPQLRRSLVRSVQRPAHIVPPALQVQTPETHASTVPHARAHEPQWLLFVERSTHTPPQFTKLPGHAPSTAVMTSVGASVGGASVVVPSVVPSVFASVVPSVFASPNAESEIVPSPPEVSSGTAES